MHKINPFLKPKKLQMLLLLSLFSLASIVFQQSPPLKAEEQQQEIYQCPMHEHIQSDKAGSCPICHMTLQKVKLKKKSTTPSATKDKSEQQEAKQASKTSNKNKTKNTQQNNLKTKKVLKSKKRENSLQNAICPMHPEVHGARGDRCGKCGMLLEEAAKVNLEEHKKHQHDTFICPMHAEVITDKDGRCPVCGMDLLKKPLPMAHKNKKYGRSIRHFAPASDANNKYAGPGLSTKGEVLNPIYTDTGDLSVIRISPQTLQNIGVRTEQAHKTDLFRHVKALGTIAVAENKLSVINVRYSGWIEKLYVDETGKQVKKGQALAEIYSPELNQAQDEYLLALKNQEKLADSLSATSAFVKSAADKLLYLGFRKSDLQYIEKKRSIMQTFTIRATHPGYILQKQIVQGSRFKSGQNLYNIGNLQSIWVTAEIYDFDSPWIELGAKATMEVNFLPGRTFSGHVRFIAPTLNPKTRTLQIRVEFANPGLDLKPGMITTLRIDSQKQENALNVPTSAILHSGERNIIFVALGGGQFEKREVVTGLTADRYRTQVLEGIQDGEWVVTSGQFLLDSESQLQESLEKLQAERLEYKRAQAKINGVQVDSNSAKHEHKKDKNGYWTCSMHPQVMEEQAGSCPICHMDLIFKSTK